MNAWKVNMQYVQLINTVIIGNVLLTYGMQSPILVLETSFTETLSDLSMVTQL